MKKLFLFIIPILLMACGGSDGEGNDEPQELKPSLSNISGTWEVTDGKYSGMRLVIKPKSTIGWIDDKGNDYAGNYYMLENVNDPIIAQQCSLVGSDNTNRIHIEDLKVGDTFKLTLGLKPFMPIRNWALFSEKVDEPTWRFWLNHNYEYGFVWKEYTTSTMKIELLTVNYFSQPTERFPLRMEKGEILTFKRIDANQM